MDGNNLYTLETYWTLFNCKSLFANYVTNMYVFSYFGRLWLQKVVLKPSIFTIIMGLVWRTMAQSLFMWKKLLLQEMLLRWHFVVHVWITRIFSPKVYVYSTYLLKYSELEFLVGSLSNCMLLIIASRIHF